MKRRFFIRQLTTGAIALSLPTALIAKPSLSGAGTQAAWNDLLTDLIGVPRQLTVAHIYSPAITPVTDLWGLVARDIHQVNRWLSIDLPNKPTEWVSASGDDGFGSYRASCEQGTLAVQWQALSQHGGTPQPPRSTLRILTDEGVIQSTVDGKAFDLVTFRGERMGQLPRVASLICPSTNRLI